MRRSPPALFAPAFFLSRYWVSRYWKCPPRGSERLLCCTVNVVSARQAVLLAKRQIGKLQQFLDVGVEGKEFDWANYSSSLTLVVAKHGVEAKEEK